MPTEEKIITEVSEPQVDESVADASAAELSPADLRFQEELEARDKNILAALDEMLARQQPPQPRRRPPEESGIERFCIGMVRKGAGMVSLSLILIFMGIVVVCCFFSADPDYLLPLKLSPIAAVLLGVELLVYHVISGKKFRIHIPAIIISALIIGGCCTMAVVLNNSYTESRVEYNNRSISAQIYERGYHELRHAADIAEIEVEVDLNPSGSAKHEGIESLSADDVVNIAVTFSGDYSSPADFVSECKTVMDGYRFLGILVTSFRFVSESRFSTYRLNIDGMFMQDYTEEQLLEKVSYVYVEDYDYVEDLPDFIEEPEEDEEEQPEQA
ncbi:MAG: hypothetical protein IJO91_03505 [Oscillospiraceae bacterium]|nr:hypothetical protein [Oscillospiraceae bacterium]